jgi:hypothetical protein
MSSILLKFSYQLQGLSESDGMITILDLRRMWFGFSESCLEEVVRSFEMVKNSRENDWYPESNK